MKRLHITRSLLIVALVALLSDGNQAMTQANMANRDGTALDSRNVVVRLYPDWQADPKAYITLEVPLAGFEVKADAMRRASMNRETASETLPGSATPGRRELDQAIVAVVPGDQQSQSVIGVVGGLVFVQFLKQGSLVLRPDNAPRTVPKPCLFLDLLGQPVANTEVEILIGPPIDVPVSSAPRVWIANAQLDQQGCLQRPQSVYGLNQFAFHVVHPDCGVVPAFPQYASDDEPHYIFKIAAMPKDRWCVFLDALGRPMAGAQVQMITSGSWENGRVTYLDPIILDDAGRLRPPPILTTPRRASFIISAADNMLALIEPYHMTEVSTREPLSLCVVPLVACGIQDDVGSVGGTVLDSEGYWVPSALIACTRVLLPDGRTLGPYWPWPAAPNNEVKVVTNDAGQFALHMPLADSEGRLGLPVPVGATYEVTVAPPAEFGCQPWRGWLAAGQDYTITLEGTLFGPEKFTGILQFEDEHGLVTDPEKISQVDLTIQVRRPSLPTMTFRFHDGQWLEKPALPFGTYEAKVDWAGKHYAFRPLRVTAESPETILFKPMQIEPFETRYRGRVIHGVNGDPIGDAIVMPLPAGTPQLDPVGSQFDPQSKTFGLLEKQMAGRMTQADPSGRFELALPIVTRPGPEHAIIAVKKDFFAFQQPLSQVVSGRQGEKPRYAEFPADKDGKIILPDIKLFPAGTVTIEPNAPDDCRGCNPKLDFLPAGESAVPWLKDLQILSGESSTGTVIRRKDLVPHQPQSVYVPAYVKMTLRLQLPDERYAPAFIEHVLVGQGRTIDFGRIDFALAVPISIKVVNSADQPLSNVTVKCLLGEDGCPGPEAVTNANGIARIPAAVQSTGILIVEYRDRGTYNMVREGMPFQVAGPEDAGKEFVLRLSDEMVKLLASQRQ